MTENARALEYASHRMSVRFLRAIHRDGDITVLEASKIIQEELGCSRDYALDFVKRLNVLLTVQNN